MSVEPLPAENIKPVRIRPVAVRAAASNVDIVQAALKSGNVEMYREAVALFKELEGMAARKAFDNAMADAKAQIPVIRKNRRVGFDHRTGSDRTEYSHEDLAEIARTVDPILSEHRPFLSLPRRIDRSTSRSRDVRPFAPRRAF